MALDVKKDQAMLEGSDLSDIDENRHPFENLEEETVADTEMAVSIFTTIAPLKKYACPCDYSESKLRSYLL